MNDKYEKEISKELKLIRRELEKMNKVHVECGNRLDETVSCWGGDGKVEIKLRDVFELK